MRKCLGCKNAGRVKADAAELPGEKLHGAGAGFSAWLVEQQIKRLCTNRD